jgi:calmodulin
MNMANGDDRVAEIEELFEQNDTDGNGDIDYQEFVALMAALDPQMPEPALAIGFGDVDTNSAGRINFDEFLAWWLAD